MGSYETVPPKEAGILKRKVSINSPFGRAVLGQSEKAKIFFKTPSGQRIGCEILKIR
jgi:transcription elongation GreA/GreB family factor